MDRFSFHGILSIDHIGEMLEQFLQEFGLMGHCGTVDRGAEVGPVVVLYQVEFFVLVYFE